MVHGEDRVFNLRYLVCISGDACCLSGEGRASCPTVQELHDVNDPALHPHAARSADDRRPGQGRTGRGVGGAGHTPGQRVPVHARGPAGVRARGGPAVGPVSQARGHPAAAGKHSCAGRRLPAPERSARGGASGSQKRRPETRSRPLRCAAETRARQCAGNTGARRGGLRTGRHRHRPGPAAKAGGRPSGCGPGQGGRLDAAGLPS